MTNTTAALPFSPLTTDELWRRLRGARNHSGIVLEAAVEAGAMDNPRTLDRLVAEGRKSSELDAALQVRG